MKRVFMTAALTGLFVSNNPYAGESYLVYNPPRFYVSTSKSIIKALINMHSFEIQLSPIG